MKNYILTITPNPALDLGGLVDNLKPNEKSYVYNETRCPGGNAINAARILRRLRVPTLTTGLLGGSTGEEIKKLLDEEGVQNNFVKIKCSSRICVTVSNKKDHQQTRLNFPGPHVTDHELQNLIKFIKNEKSISLLVIGGSLPQGVRPKDLLKIMNLAKKLKIACAVDCPGNILRVLIAGNPILIKPNLTEFQEMTGSSVKTIKSIKKLAHVFLDHIPYVCISSVEGGALLITKTNSYFGKIPNVVIRSSVGAGDSMVGAMLAQIYKRNSSEIDILRWGLAAAAATLAQTGTTLGSAHEIRRLYKKTFVSVI